MHNNKEKIIGSLTMQTFWVTLGDKGIPCALKGGGGRGCAARDSKPWRVDVSDSKLPQKHTFSYLKL